MEFFDMLGKKATEAYKMTADKTGKIAKEAKLKLKMSELKSQINDIYKEIGAKVYEKHIREEKLDIENDLLEQCTKIDVISDQIEDMLEECLSLRDKKQCPNCNSQIEKEAAFCNKCGTKQDERPAQEVEVLEKLENTEVSPEREQEKEDVKVRLEEKIESNEGITEQDEQKIEDNLQKTVEVESAMEQKNKE